MNCWTRFLALSTFALGTLGQGAAIAALSPQPSSLEVRDRDTFEVAQRVLGQCVATRVDTKLYEADPDGSSRQTEFSDLQTGTVVQLLEYPDSNVGTHIRVAIWEDDVSDTTQLLKGFVKLEHLRVNSSPCGSNASARTTNCAVTASATMLYRRDGSRYTSTGVPLPIRSRVKVTRVESNGFSGITYNNGVDFFPNVYVQSASLSPLPDTFCE